MIEDYLNREVWIIDEAGEEIGRVNRTAFVLEHINLLGVRPPDIVDNTVSKAEVERYSTEFFDKLNAICTPIVEWANNVMPVVQKALKPLSDWVAAHPEFTNLYETNRPRISHYRVLQKPRFRSLVR